MFSNKNIPPQSGKTFIVTGANTGLGFETALALYKAGANVIIACRNLQKAEQAIVKLKKSDGSGTLESGVLDLSDLNSVKQFADAFLQNHQRLDVLINNAAVATPPAMFTTQGFELQFGVNFLGHFALAGLLYPLLQATKGSRIISLTSNGYQNTTIDFDNLKSEKDYNPLREYRQSKLATLIFSIELDRRIIAKGQQVLSIAVQPGANKTDLTRHSSEEEIAKGIERIGGFMEPWQGALCTLYASLSDEAQGGSMYEPDGNNGYSGYPTLATIQRNAKDSVVAKKLWELAEKITEIYFPV
ncbi:MAG: oxidoreductase [Bacteroidota bacterium]|nr:oxidoreductase [Bacteroidota bacterium]